MWANLATAHDTWLQTNTNLVRVKDVVHVDLMLGNHGNDHRDFKLAGKPDAATSTLEVVSPNGERFDLKDRLVDLGYTPQEGFLTARFMPSQPGLYVVGHTADKVVSYGPIRSIESSKTYFLASTSLDKIEPQTAGFDQPLGHAMELVPLVHPVTPMGPGSPIRREAALQRPAASGISSVLHPAG